MKLAKPYVQATTPEGPAANLVPTTMAKPVQPQPASNVGSPFQQNAGPSIMERSTPPMTGPATATVVAGKITAAPPQSKTSSPTSKSQHAERPKKPRKKKPDAAKNCWQIYVGATMDRYNAIKRNAAALGLSASQYLLMCESETASKIIEQFINYIETRYRIDNEMIIERRRIEQDINPTSKASI
jgi:hypothetical protein